MKNKKIVLLSILAGFTMMLFCLLIAILLIISIKEYPIITAIAVFVSSTLILADCFYPDIKRRIGK